MTIPFETIDKGEGSGIADPRKIVVRDAGEWRALWALHAGEEARAPAVDFSSRMVAAVFAGERPTPGFEVAVVDVVRDGAALVVITDEQPPRPGLMAPQIIVAPFHIVSLPTHDGDVWFRGRETAGPRSGHSKWPPVDRVPGTSSTGLPPSSAAALAYVAGPFSGALLLAVERTSPFVRFHAWQSLLGLGTLGVAAVVCLGLAFALLVASPAAFWTMLWISAVAAASWIVVWGFCLFQAWKGRAWRLPLVGVYAARLADRLTTVD